jgi:HEAT repeat protein
VNDFASMIDAFKKGDFHSRWEAVKQLSSCGEEVLPFVLPLLLDSQHAPEPDFEQQWFMVKLLGAFHHPDAILALTQVLETSTDEDLCNQAAQSLVGMGKIAVQCLAPWVDDPYRLPMVVKALVQIQQPEVVPLLLNAFSESSAELRVLILNALDQFQDPRIFPLLLQGLEDSSAEVCQVAITSITTQNEHTPEERVQIIAPFLDDPRAGVPNQAAHTLGRLATDSAAITLINKCCDVYTSPTLQSILIRSLGWVGSTIALEGLVKIWDNLSPKSPLPEKLLQEILASLAQMVAPEVKAKAAQQVLEFVQSTTLQPFSVLKSTAILSLGRIADSSMIPVLIDLLADPDYGVRLHIIAALKQISAEIAYQEIQSRSGLTDRDAALSEGLAIARQEW